MTIESVKTTSLWNESTEAVFEIVLGALVDIRSTNELTFGGPASPKKYAVNNQKKTYY